MDDSQRTGKSFLYITNTKGNSAFYPSGVGKSSTGLPGWGWSGTCLPASGGR